MPDQAQFRGAVLDAGASLPPGLGDGRGGPAGKRFDVYRNNVAVSLTEALNALFPVVRKLVGDEFFTAMSGVYLRQEPPGNPILAQWGAGFPAFLETFPPAASLPYLPDTARLELALRQSYHAADPIPLHIDEAALMDTPFTLAPAARLIESAHPIHAIYQANTDGTPLSAQGPQAVLVTRAQYDPAPQLLEPASLPFIRALKHGATLDAALTGLDDFEPQSTLGLLLSKNALVHFQPQGQLP